MSRPDHRSDWQSRPPILAGRPLPRWRIARLPVHTFPQSVREWSRILELESRWHRVATVRTPTSPPRGAKTTWPALYLPHGSASLPAVSPAPDPGPAVRLARTLP